MDSTFDDNSAEGVGAEVDEDHGGGAFAWFIEKDSKSELNVKI